MTRGVVRVGDTVRRPSKASSPFVARLLARLEEAGCDWAPRYLGRDAQGRDVLSYLDGTVPAKWVAFSDLQLQQAARIVRALHDVTRASELVCHHDPGPNNFVFRDEAPVALIDFDLAAPGDPLEDLGYMAWSWCISSKPSRGPVTAQAAQVRVLADAYGASAAQRAQLTDHIFARQLRNIRFWSALLADPSDVLITPRKMLEIIEWSAREARFTADNRSVFAALTG